MAKVNKVEVEIVATDEASPKIDRLEKKIDGLESDEARIIVTADISRLEKQLAGSKRLMEELEGDELTVQMRATGRIEDDLRAARELFDQLDGKTGTVTLTANTSGLDESLRRARTGLDDVNKSADSSKSVLANMVGNATQDLGALGGVAGSVGVAIGQMGEYMADAAAAGERFGSILRSFATVAGPIAAISAGLAALNAIQRSNAESAQVNADSTERWAAAMESGTDAAGAYTDALAETGKVMLDLNQLTSEQNAVVTQGQRDWHGLGGIFELFADDVEDVSSVMAEAGLTVEQLARAVEHGTAGQQAWTEAVNAANLSEADQARLLGLLTQETEAHTRAKENAANAERIFARTLVETSNAADIIQQSIELARTNLERFGADGVEQMNQLRSALADAGAALDAIGGGVAGVPTFTPTTATPRPVASPNVTIINPPGTPAATAGQLTIYQSRNGVRTP